MRRHPRPPVVSVAVFMAVAAIVSAGLAGPAHAQAVLGHTLDNQTGVPLAGAFITLNDDAGRQVAGFLSRPDGRFLIQAPGPGRYTLRAELIGYGTVDRAVDLGPDETALETLRLPLRAVRLEGVVARSSRVRECALGAREGDALARLWTEARKGLRVAAWAEESQSIRASGHTYQRVLKLTDLEVRAERVQRARSLGRQAFAAADPATIRAEGFVVESDDGGRLYRGADAAVLLSDDFLETHCFRLRERADEGLVGLAFEPVRDRNVPDIRGVLWVDGESFQLRTLEYRYTDYGFPYRLPESRYGGFTRFRHLPGGGVAVERWWIRMPSLAHRVDRGALANSRRCGMAACDDIQALVDLSLAGLVIEEEGGAVLSFHLADGTVLPAADRAAIAGAVIDSTAASPAPLAGAEVVIEGTAHRAVTDARGEFRLDNLQEGTYRLRFEHPRLLELGIERPGAVVTRTTPGELARVTLATPSPATLAAARCRDRSDARAAATPGPILHGVVRDAGTGAPIGGARVRLITGEPGNERAAADRRESDAASDRDAARERVLAGQETDAAGRYLFCDIPPEPGRLAADFLGRGRHEVGVVPAGDGPTQVDLDLVLSAVARVDGRVVRADDGEGVGGVVVRVRGTDRSTVTTGTGAFRFDSLAAGAVTLETEHVAYAPSEGAVSVAGGETVRVELRVAHQMFEMEPLVVTARSRPLLMEERMAGFYMRQARGLGTFIDREDLDRRSPARVTDILREVPGLTVASTGDTGRIIRGRATRYGTISETQNEACFPMIYVDGTKITTRTDSLSELHEAVGIIDGIPTSEIAGIEVYAGAASVPGEFAGLDANCGVIAVWTRVRDRTGTVR